MKNKKGFEFSFGWLFALIVGAVIIFLAIYAAIRLVTTERTTQDTETAKQLELILTPLETGSETGKSATPIVLSSATRIYNNCTNLGNFGEQKIAIATSSGIGGKWQEPGFFVTSYNKYLFSSDVTEGKEVYVFSKPFNMPFKVANLLFLWSESYCFVNPPGEIEDDINDLNLRKINTTSSVTMCDKKSKKVCFYTQEPACDIIVNPSLKSVTNKNKQTVFYEDSLIYGAIFSQEDIYECQVKRLMKRASEVALLYNAKSESVASRASGCSSELQGDLMTYAAITAQTNSSSELTEVYFLAQELENKNKRMSACKLWEE